MNSQVIACETQIAIYGERLVMFYVNNAQLSAHLSSSALHLPGEHR